MNAFAAGPWVEKDGYIFASGERIVAKAVSYDGDQSRAANACLIASAPELLAALEAYESARAMSSYGDASDFEFPGQSMRKPGESAWGYICAKHGLGYQSGCICCSEEFSKHQAQKNRQAVQARNEALCAASDAARAAITKATGAAA